VDIQTVKLTSGGWLVNDSAHVPNAPGNRHYQLVQDWIAAGNTPDPEFTTAEIEARRIADIKQKAGAAIVALLPEWKQRNLIARGLELTDKIANGGTLTTAEQAESDALKVQWAAVTAIRTASNTAETSGTLAADFNP